MATCKRNRHSSNLQCWSYL